MMLTLVLFLAQGVAVPQQAAFPAQSQVTVASARVLPSAPSALKGTLETPEADTLRTTDPAPASAMIEPIRPSKPAKPSAAASRRTWLALTVAQHSAATFDAWTTRRRLQSGGYHENNPLLKPFAGNNSLYAVVQVTPAAFDFLGNRMRQSDRPWMRRLWWVPQIVQTGTHLACGAINLTR